MRDDAQASGAVSGCGYAALADFGLARAPRLRGTADLQVVSAFLALTDKSALYCEKGTGQS
jgi:hypothetical protein